MLDVIKNKFVYLIISWVFFVVSVFMILFWNLNLWIDMTWWIQMDYNYSKDLDIEKINEEISNSAKSVSEINNTSVYKVTWENTLVVVAGFKNDIDEKTLDILKSDFRESTLDTLKTYDESVEESRYINIWKSFWDYIKDKAIKTLLIAIILITLYVTWAFSGVVSWISIYSFSIITLVTLFHDVIISSWLYVFASKFFPQFQIDTFFITALLTILGYSINDTIVVFDRVRSNLRQFGWKKWAEWKTLEQIVNLSVNETVKRSIYTSLTLLFVLLTIFFFWPDTISWFMLVMIFGTLVWTYSSIFIASPLLYLANKNKKLAVYKKKEINPEDKIVV